LALSGADITTLNAQAAALKATLLPVQAKMRKRDRDPRASERFAQLPPTHAVVPASEVAPTLTERPPHRTEGWPVAISEGAVVPATLRGSVEVHEYMTPTRVERRWGVEIVRTPGWYILMRASDGTKRFSRVFDGEGPVRLGTPGWAEEGRP